MHGTELSALVIGHPDLEGWDKFIDLPGARDEAQHVAECLTELGYQTDACIDATHTDILESLHRRRWRILHLAGHGEHDYRVEGHHGAPTSAGDKPLSGMVIGHGVLLTPGDVEQMRYVPELVFINCCHLGKIRSQDKQAFPALAANLGVQFIRMGVKAVVAAGWAVGFDAPFGWMKQVPSDFGEPSYSNNFFVQQWLPFVHLYRLIRKNPQGAPAASEQPQ